MGSPAPESASHYLDLPGSGNAFAYSWDHTPVPVPSSPVADPEGVSAIISQSRSLSKGPHCRQSGISRASLTVIELEQADRKLATPTVPPTIALELWGVSGEIRTRVVSAKWTPVSWAVARGFVLQVSGLLLEGYELRWAIDTAVPIGATRAPLLARVRWVVDRAGGGFQSLAGPNVTIDTNYVSVKV